MQQNEFEALLKEIGEKENLPQALELLKASDEEEIAQAAESLTGQFGLAEVDGEKRIYHITIQADESGEEKEFVEHVMNEGEHLIKFAAWFFETFFEIKQKDTYKAAGKTYQQPKR
ncbi:hypothetical protein DA096_02695 [Vibrio rotiferianus]|jgi:hypothetical protein|uniref:Uncharacterized protein n=1 Tax=Vibrio rotiferianus TaxID=190895 RepID=A0ABX3D2K3_9VIBR|nr:hypothetical protein [Vibrio rotiferianus]ASI94751.1 hypothetical protein BSZ04_07015 [Vibrio rotiferianus]NOH69461.1 hypothetical protein [Vibrio rotiferianus]OHY88950.1 hypothetical protein BI375_08910 [Vibrio rotiferianus]PIB12949.1 hypothetical protein B853_21596 [Vibrio rotiferianus CAIM 577 = LMG 21460]TMX42912.1 hypothetical protein DA095_03985 [Vibrio rotiferianus]|tara:strand:+ start:261 stop:608 length:348 start_codon:yes stop_codon:yes gene_type:complete